MPNTYLSTFISIFFGLLEWSIIIHVIYSWIKPHSKSTFYQNISSIVTPLFRLVKKVIPKFGPLDLTPLATLIAIEVIAYFLLSFT